MNRQHLLYVYAATSIGILVVLVWLTLATPPDLSYMLPALLFGVLIVFTDTFGVRLPAGMVSLLPMTTVAAYLVMGPVPTGWAAFVGTLTYGLIRLRWAEPLELPQIEDGGAFITILTANITIHTASILASGAVFRLLGGETPLASISPSQILPLILLGLTYLAVNHLTISPAIATRSREALRAYLRSLPNLLFYEGGPLVFAPLVALIYTRLGVVLFILFALLVTVSSLITRGLAITSGRLERRVKELGGLQAVGQALSASLNLDRILEAIHTQVAALMPAENFYVALYDAETDEVSFPLAFEDGERRHWRSRPRGQGLTEHILRTREPLLIPRDVGTTLQEIGIDQIGRLAASWLGVPILAEQEPIGVIAIQSYDTAGAYDVSHEEVLVTIASQAAVAIQNAHLYERTDEALARRVQELASILRTTSEGIMLFDRNWQVLAANRALASFLGTAQTELVGQKLDAPRSENDQSLITLIGYTPESLQGDCQETAREDALHKQAIIAPGPPERHVERTLTPVRDREGEITGWLLVLRDISEEVKLAQLREDMMHMLVHDLRSPLTVLRGSLEMIEIAVDDGKLEDVRFLEQMAQRGSDRMLRMVNELLDISKLESGEFPLHPEAVEAESLLRDISTRLRPLAADANIAINMLIAPNLPSLYVDSKFTDRVLHNLVDNAIKFTPDNGHVKLWAKLDPEKADTMLIGVTDTGPGIPPQERHRVFEKFQQTSATGRRVGTGLGLPFCKLAVEAHGGQIWVESEVGKGSTFVMRLPTAKPET
ncbi:MAG: GAF domain-containing protein [Anaerolineae bacterium]|nr:GAF domain-containing protein [Anaerolineae bacterium]